MTGQNSQPNAAAAGSFDIGGELSVNRLGFGAMRLCGPDIWEEPEDPEAARAVLRRALELGINLIDTADAYGPEVNEWQIAEALYPYLEDLVIATKGHRAPGLGRLTSPPEQVLEGSLELWVAELVARLFELRRFDALARQEQLVGELP